MTEWDDVRAAINARRELIQATRILINDMDYLKESAPNNSKWIFEYRLDAQILAQVTSALEAML